jgi:hypothetical protein
LSAAKASEEISLLFNLAEESKARVLTEKGRSLIGNPIGLASPIFL